MFICVLFVTNSKAQEQLIDRVIAVVGLNPILYSELEAQYQQMIAQKEEVNENTKCKIVEELLYQKLLLAQAQKDSLTVTDAQVEQEIDKRMNYYIQQFGSEEKFESFYGKSVEDYKTDLHDNVEDLLLAQQMQSKITGDITVTPSDVKNYFNSIPPDSVPLINSEVEVGEITKKPKVRAEAKKEAKEKIEGIRKRIVSGDASFASMAALYSEDPGSSSKGGLYESIQRGQFVPEWDARAFSLKPNEVSDVFETVYGYFIIQPVERRGEEVDCRSLLLTPKIAPEDLLKSKVTLDSIYNRLSADTTSFNDMAAKYSDSEESKNSGGLIINPTTGNTHFEMDLLGQMDQNVAFAVDKLKIGEYTKPMPYTTHDGKNAYHILYLKSRTEPHRANLKDDYQRIQNIALEVKQQDAINTWIKKKLGGTYIHINDDYKSCSFNNNWISN